MKKRILIAGLFHETHTFVEERTKIADFAIREGLAMLGARGDGSPLGGTLEVAEECASVDDTGKIVSDTFEGEFRRSLENMERILKAAGSSLAEVVQTRNYVRDPADVKELNQLYAEYFKPPYPARTTITGCLPETLRFEIECIAVAREEGGN